MLCACRRWCSSAWPTAAGTSAWRGTGRRGASRPAGAVPARTAGSAAVVAGDEAAPTALGQQDHQVDETEAEAPDDGVLTGPEQAQVEVAAVRRGHVRQSVVGGERRQGGVTAGGTDVDVAVEDHHGVGVDPRAVLEHDSLRARRRPVGITSTARWGWTTIVIQPGAAPGFRSRAKPK